MSLATRCTACGTVFRVVQDQLRVSSGWVRCGRCGEVFNAIESLVDAGAGPSASPPSTHASRVMDDLARVARTGVPAATPVQADAPQSASASARPRADDEAPGPENHHGVAGAAPVVVDGPSGPDQEPVPRSEFPAAGALDARPDGQPDEAAAAAFERLGGEPAPDGTADGGSGDGVQPVPDQSPTFVRRFDRAARWRRPWVRVCLALACSTLAGWLAWQVNGTHHDWLAARWPAWSTHAEALCRLQGCRVVPPRRIDALAVESSGLVRTGAPGTYRLTVSLRNRADMPVRWPSIDLVLTDADGQTAVRRILTPQELGIRADRLNPGAETSAAATLLVAGGPVVGYTIEIFYP